MFCYIHFEEEDIGNDLRYSHLANSCFDKPVQTLVNSSYQTGPGLI